MVEISPSVELVTLPENSAENFCSKVSGPVAADGVVDQPGTAGIGHHRRDPTWTAVPVAAPKVCARSRRFSSPGGANTVHQPFSPTTERASPVGTVDGLAAAGDGDEQALPADLHAVARR